MDKIDANPDWNIAYISRGIVRCGDIEAALKVTDDLGTGYIKIYEPNQYADGVIFFSGSHIKTERREILKNKIIAYARQHGFDFIVNQLLLDGQDIFSFKYIPGELISFKENFHLIYCEGADAFEFIGRKQNNALKIPSHDAWNANTPAWLHNRQEEIIAKIFQFKNDISFEFVPLKAQPKVLPNETEKSAPLKAPAKPLTIKPEKHVPLKVPPKPISKETEAFFLKIASSMESAIEANPNSIKNLSKRHSQKKLVRTYLLIFIISFCFFAVLRNFA